MISFNEFSKFPLETKSRIIECVFASNIQSDIDKIKKDIFKNNENSKFLKILLESITLKYNSFFGRYYEVTGLFFVSQKEFGINLEEDNS